MNDLPEFAEEYGNAERVRFVIVGVAAGAVVVAVGKLWLFPWLGELANSAPCHTVFGFNGVAVLWYSLFAGLPLFGAVVVACTTGHHGYKILRDGQAPPLGQRVFRPTRIKRGAKAKVVGYLNVLACSPLFALAVWGVLQAKDLANQEQQRKSCTKTANPSIEGTSTIRLRLLAAAPHVKR